MITFEKDTLIGLSIKDREKINIIKERLLYLGDSSIKSLITSMDSSVIELDTLVRTLHNLYDHMLKNYSEDEVAKVESIIKDIIREDSLAYDILFE